MPPEIKKLKQELQYCMYDFDNYKLCSQKLVNAFETYIEKLQKEIKWYEEYSDASSYPPGLAD